MDAVLLNKMITMLPKSIKAELMTDDDHILVTLHEPHQNLRFDGGAFESWTLMLHLKSPRSRIILEVAPIKLDHKDEPRFKRLLYRVYHFDRLNYNWFSIGTELRRQVDAFASEFYTREKCMAPPTRETANGDRGEQILQGNFSSDHSILKALPECEFSEIHEDLPLNLYWGKGKVDMRASNRIFPGGRRYVDLWSLKKKQLNIFELKYNDPYMGIVSELFFYACLCRDIFFDPVAANITFPPLSSRSYRGVSEMYDDNAKKPIEKINAWFLVDQFHPALDAEYVCEMLSTKEMLFQVLRYSYDMPITFQVSDGR